MREKIKSKQKMKNSLSEANFDNLFKKNTRMKKELTMNDLNNNFERDFYSNRNNISEIIINKSNSMVKLINNNYKKFDIFPNIKKELINISYLWNSSGISSKYKVNFINNYQLMTKEEKIKLIKEEKQKIEILIKKLKQFNGDYCLRKKIIKKIKEEINLIKKENTEDNKGDIIDKIIKYLGELRLYSVNTVLNFYEVKNLINILFKNNSTIIDLKMLYKLYLYDKDYLLKINDDISFIKECTVLPNYIEMNNFRGMDTFFVNCSYKLIDNTDKINDKKIIPIDDKTKAEIKKCKYIIKNEKFCLPQNSFSFFISNYLKTPKPQKKLILKLNNSQISHKKLITVNGYKKNFTKTNKSSKNEKKENSYPPEIKKELKKYKLLVDNAKNLEKENENLKKIMERNEKEKNEEKEKAAKEKEKADKEIGKERLKRIEVEKQNQELIRKLRRKKSENSIDSKKSKNKDINNSMINKSKEGKISIDAIKPNNNINLIKKNEINDDYCKEFNDANEIGEDFDKINDDKNKEKEILKKDNKLNEKKGEDNNEKLINKDNLNNDDNKNIQNKIEINNNKNIDENFEKNNEKESTNKNNINNDENIIDKNNNNINKDINTNKVETDDKNENNQTKEKDKTFDEKNENLEEIKINDNSNNNFKETKNHDIGNNNESNKEEIINTDIIKVDDKQNQNNNEDEDIKINVIKLNSDNENNNKDYNDKKKDLINKKDKIKEKTGYKVEYYLDKLDNLISRIKKDIPIYKINDVIKSLFKTKLEEKIYDKTTYSYGMYPKIITCINKESDTISGICSFYYENIGENNLLTVRINTLFAIGDWKSQFIKMVNFLKSNAQFNQIKIILFIADTGKKEEEESLGIKKFLEEKLLFNVKNVTKEKKVKEIEMAFIRNEVKSIFCFNLKTVLSSYNKKKADEAEILDDEIKDIMEGFHKDDKYINLFPVFSILNHLDKGKRFNYYKLEFLQKGFKLNFENINIDFMKIIKDKTFDNDDIKNFCKNYETCLYRQLYPIYKQNNLILPCDALEINLNKNLLFCQSLSLNGYYYNKIAKDIFKGYDKDTKCNYYIVPLNDQNHKLFFYEMNENSIQKYIDDKKNIYKLFVDLLTENDKEDKNNPLKKDENENNDISLYIPSFKISDNFHYSNINHIIKKIASVKDINQEGIKFISFDGLFSIEFNGDNFISNNFIYSISEDEENIVIKNNFFFGLINFSILKHSEFIYNSFLQLAYVTQEHWKRC